MFDNKEMALVDALIDFFYLADVLVSFRTTYMDLLNGVDVTDSYKIAKRYIGSGEFFVDFLSSIPLDTLTNVKLLNSVGLLKLFRYRRLTEVIKTSNVNQNVKVQLKLTYLIYQSILFMHIMASAFYVVIAINQKLIWLPSFICPYTTQQYIYFIPDTYHQFLIGMYTGYYLATDGEIVARNENEFFWSVGFLLVGQVFYSYIIGEISNQQGELGQEDLELQQKIDLTNSAMANLKIESNLRNAVARFILNTHATQKKQKELTEFLESIPPSFRVKCTSWIFMKISEQNVVLMSLLKQQQTSQFHDTMKQID